MGAMQKLKNLFVGEDELDHPSGGSGLEVLR